MITVNTFFSGTLNTVDAVIGNFVNNAYSYFVRDNAQLITLLFTFYVMYVGYQFLTHQVQFNMSTVLKRLMVMLCVYGLVMNWHLYHLFVYNVFTNEPTNIAKILIKSADSNVTTDNVVAALDGIYAAVMNASSGLFGQVSFSISSMAFLIYGLLVYVIGTLMCVFALLLLIYAKMMMAVSLALGPIFILFILWDSTKGMFEAWLNKLVTIALIPVVTSAILVMMLSVINVTLPQIKLPTDQLQFVGIAPFLGLTLANTMILTQVFRIASSLGGGITLASISAGAGMVSSVLNKVGRVANNMRPESREEKLARKQEINSALERFARNNK